ncbi:MAG: hypothetical protein ACKO04_01925 [Actinomycetes bacterium]
MTDPTGPDSARPAASAVPGPGSQAASGGAAQADWADQVTDLIVDTVDKVRDRTTGPILEVSKGIVHGVVALLILTPILVLFFAGAIRLLNWAIPGDVWIAYAVLGVLLLLLGSFLWSRRAPRPTSPR